jgi:hypothetical protein
MIVDEARGFLGLRRAAYFNIMSKVHPDHGSTNEFAKELNPAKAMLLGE